MLSPSTRLQHQGNSECLQQRRHRAIPRFSLPLRRGTGTGYSESRHNRDIVIRSQKETEESRTPSCQEQQGRNNRTHRRRCGLAVARKKRDHPTGSDSFPMRLCSRLDSRYSEAYKPRSRGDPAPSPQKPGRRGKINHAQLWSERFEKGCGGCR